MLVRIAFSPLAKIQRYCWLSVCCALFGNLFGIASADEGFATPLPNRTSIHVVSDNNFPPYLFLNADGKVEGFLVDLWQLWEKKSGIKVNLTATNWTDAQKMLLDGHADVIDMIYKTPSREPFYEFSNSYANSPAVIFSHKSIGGINDIKTIKGFQIGVQAGDACIDKLTSEGVLSLRLFPNYREMILAAEQQEIKLFCLDEFPGNYYLYQMGLHNEFLRSFELYRGYFHRAVRKGDTETLRLVETWMSSISKDEHKALNDKWFGTSISGEQYAKFLGLVTLALLMLGGVLAIWNFMLRLRVADKTAELEAAMHGLRQANESSQEANETLSATLNGIPDLLFKLDHQGNYVDVFASQDYLLAAPKVELVGKNVRDILPSESAQIIIDSIENASLKGSDAGRVINVTRNGEDYWFELSTTRQESHSGGKPHFLMLSRNINERRKTEQMQLLAKEAALLAERDIVFSQLFDAAPVAMAFSRGHQIDSVNKCFVDLFGYEKDEISSFEEWWRIAYPDPEYREWVLQRWMDAMRLAETSNGTIESLDYRVKAKNGRELTLLIGGQIIGDGIIVTLTDISELKQIEKDLLAAKNAADDARAAKSTFLANMSHEIRTPMNAVIGMTELCLQTQLNDRQRNFVTKIQSSAAALLHVINDILDFSKIEAGKMQMESIPFEIDDVFDQLAAVLSMRAEAQGIELIFDVYQDLAPKLIGDPLRLGQVLTNLVSNALKFSNGGTVRVSMKQLENTGDTVVLQFSVEDQGIGMSAEQADRLFAPFVQADASTTRRYGGTGLGLAISSHLVTLMKGRIWVESQPNRGSTFSFTATFSVFSDVTSIRSSIAEFALSLGEHTDRPVLVIDDNPIARLVLASMIEQLGFRVFKACDAEEAVNCVTAQSTEKFLCCFVDWRMPHLDGIKTIQLLRNLFVSIGARHVPSMILVSAFCNDDELSLAGDEFDGLLAKPITARHVYGELARSLGIFDSKLLESESNRRDKNDWSAFRGIDILLVEDLAINQEVMLELLSGVGIFARVAGNGELALAEVARKVPDLILMDCQMPVMDGFTATRQLRLNPLWKSLPVIALTANAMAEDRQRCVEAGMNSHVAKPLRMEDLFEAMQSCLGDWQQAKIATTGSLEKLSPISPSISIAGIDTEVGLRNVGGNVKLYEKVLRQFNERNLKEFPEQFRVAAEIDDWTTMIRLAHSLKGLALTIGAGELANSAISLETACVQNDPTLSADCFSTVQSASQRVSSGIELAFDI